MPPAFDRRRFLSLSAGAAAGLVAAPSWLRAAGRALGPGARRLVVLELFGGNDGLNTLVPYEDDAYHRARPTIGLSAGEVLKLDELNGLHPALERLRRWYHEGCMTIVRDVGYPGPNLSHFTSRDIWSTAAPGALQPAEGWLGSWAEREAAGEDLALLAIGSDAAPRLVRGATRLAPAVPELSGFRFDAGDDEEGRARLATFAALAGEPGADPETAYVQATVELARRSARRLAGAARARHAGAWPATPLGRDLAAVADVIAADLPTRVFHVELAGFDTHTKQVAEHARLLAQVDAALHAFLDELRALGRLDDTLVLTTSEFGRRVAESGVGDEAGSDHGAASIQMLFGGRVRPGLVGPQPDLERLDPDGNLAHRVDFRSVLATVLEGWLGADARAVLGGPFPTLPLLETA